MSSHNTTADTAIIDTNPNADVRVASPARSSGSWLALAALASVLVIAHNAPMGTQTATASYANFASQEPQTPFNATQQRREMIAQLERIERRLGQVETAINKGIKVTVTDMPAITIKNVSDFKD